MEIPKSSVELMDKLNINRYQLVSMLSKRAKEIMFGAKPLVDGKTNSCVEIAMRELIENKIKPLID